MPTLCDFSQIVGEAPVSISHSAFEKKFDTGGRKDNHTALLILNVRGLTRADKDAEVKVNEQVVGKIVGYGGLTDAMAQNWYTQMIAFPGASLKDGDNELQIDPVAGFDRFEVKNVICFFHQSS